MSCEHDGMDEVALLPDGTIAVTLGGQCRVLRRIRLGEYATLRERLDLIRSEEDAAGWFAQAVTMLTGEAPPIPAWAMNPGLPPKWIEHWRTVPLGPWIQHDERVRDPRRRRPDVLLVEGVFAELAPIYEGLAAHNIDTDVADRMEIWKVASVFGMWEPAAQREARHEADRRDAERHRGRSGHRFAPPGDNPSRPAPPTPGPAPATRRDVIAERMAYARGEGPKPEWTEPDDSAYVGNLLSTKG